jgi:hypothetical protein
MPWEVIKVRSLYLNKFKKTRTDLVSFRVVIGVHSCGRHVPTEKQGHIFVGKFVTKIYDMTFN